jgi:branched-chain amino acid transport system substrate-binding protein
MGPNRFGSAGNNAFSFGNAAQDEGAAMAEWAYGKGWTTADVVTDNLLVYFQNVCQAFTARFQQLGGKIVDKESFKQGDKTIGNVATRINSHPAKMVAFCTSFGYDQPAFVTALRTLKNNTPIMNSWAGDGNYWWPKSPKVTNFYFVTYASALTPDPDPAVRAFEAKMKATGQPAYSGGFITGADAIDAIAYAIKQTGGSTDPAKLAAVLSKLNGFKTLGGPITFTKLGHSVTGRTYRVVQVNNNVAKVVGEHTTQVVPNIH